MEVERLETGRRRWPRRLRVAGLVLLALLLVVLAVVWTLRVNLATDYIDTELARRGVQASYRVKRIGFGTQMLENLVIGDPHRPDLVAREVHVQILFGFTGPRVGLITARGVRLAGRMEGGKLRFGQVDRLLPPPSGLPFRLPDQRVAVEDAAITLDTPAGRVALGLRGRGNLADGFRGALAIVSPGLRLGECRIAGPAGRFAVRVADLRPQFRGPLAIRSVRCGRDLAVERALFDVDALFAPGLDNWRGATVLRAASLRAGTNRFAGVEGRLAFGGDARTTAGRVDIGAQGAALGVIRTAAARYAGRYAVSPRSGDLMLDGEAVARGVVIEGGALGTIATALRGAAATPVGPIGEALARAVLRAGRGGADARATIKVLNGDGGGAVRLGDLEVVTRSGARLRVAGGQGPIYGWPQGALRLDGDIAVSGGGFPDMRFTLAPSGGGFRGSGRIAPMAAGGARLALGPIAFAASRDGRTLFRTVAVLDGPFDGGRVTGLTVPLSGRFGRGGFALGEGCVTAGFRALQVQNLRLGPARLPLCPLGRALLGRGGAGAELRAPRFAGRLGSTPIAIAANRLRVDQAGFTASALAVRLGAAGRVSRLDVASLAGRFGGGGAAGRFAGLSGDLANVPLLVSQGAGGWSFRRGALALDGRVIVADRRSPERFRPLVSEDFRLTLVDNRIRANGWLHHPASGTRVTRATIDHNLATGTGHALLDVPGVTFTQGFQPEALTPLTLGVVALVEGTLAGQGRIDWDGRGSRSTGTFSTAGMNLAAPFGPVEGLTTTVNFTDLLGLASAPGQEARVDLIRAGIDVHDGILRYQLRPDFHVAIESGRWPLAGGTLILDPTILDFSRESTKNLTFRVEAMDAARFVQMMAFSNIAATGTFDGTIPMQFGRGGGRIVGGQLAAREGGGTLTYIGELSDQDLGTYGVLAFNALKSLRYSRFDIALDGALDGEFLTRINLDGIARDPVLTTTPSGGISGLVAGRALSQLARIPFEFNIRIAGRFRALLATARSFEDPTPLIQAVLPQLLQGRASTVSNVQDEESEPVQ